MDRIPIRQFASKDSNVGGCFDADANSGASDLTNMNDDSVSDLDRLIFLAAKNQHVFVLDTFEWVVHLKAT